MAGAGFYYEPTGSDRTLCFQCGICLLYWEPTDEPWSEHERHSNNCPYVMGKFTDNVPMIVSESSSPAQQHYSTEKISCWSEVYHTSCWASGSNDGVVTVWDLKIGMHVCSNYSYTLLHVYTILYKATSSVRIYIWNLKNIFPNVYRGLEYQVLLVFIFIPVCICVSGLVRWDARSYRYVLWERKRKISLISP